MTKRIIGFLLALCLIVGLLPMIALAEEATTTTPADPETPAPPPPATLIVTTGDITASIVWKPEMSEGMAPAYAKTTAEGSLVLEGATEADYNLKAEWPTGGTPTLTLKDATLANNNRQIDKTEEELNKTGAAIPSPETINVSGTEDFVILVKGTNNIMGRHDTKPTTTAAYRSPTGVYANNKGTLTIKGDSQADSLTIDNYSGAIIEKMYNALTIENVTFKGFLHQTGSNGQYGVTLSYLDADCADKTNFTVRNADFTLEDKGNKYHGNILIMFCGTKTNTYSATNTGDMLFQNSKIRIYRNNGTSSSQDGSTIIRYGKDSTFTIDSCDVLIYSRFRTVAFWPTLTNVNVVSAGDMVLAPGTSVSGSTLSKIQLTHICSGTATGDCTVATVCAVCGAAMGAAQTAHTPAADDGDCTTAIACANEGCKVVLTEAKEAHTAIADDGDCTTAVTCANAGCKYVFTPAAASHTSPADRTDCSVASNCTVCNKVLAAGEHTGGVATCKDKAVCTICKQAYGELAAHTGGTATCKDKAVCTVCNQAYGELSTTHVPAADDGDCTTAIKCTVCEAEVTAAKAHTYADAKDTTCENAGCNNIRTVTENPPTGDISILLTAAVALSSAVGFAGVSVLRKKEN